MSRRLVWFSLLVLVAAALPALAGPPAPPTPPVKVRILSPDTRSHIYAGKTLSVETGMDDPEKAARKIQITLIGKSGAVATASSGNPQSMTTVALALPRTVPAGTYTLVAQALDEDGTSLGDHKLVVTISAPAVGIGWVQPTTLVKSYPGRAMDVAVLLDDPAHVVRSVVFSSPADPGMKVTVPFIEAGQRWAASLPIPAKVPAGSYKVIAAAFAADSKEPLATSEQSLEVLKAGVSVGFIEPGDRVAHIDFGGTLNVLPGLEDPASLVHTLSLHLMLADKEVATVEQPVKHGQMTRLELKLPRDVVPGKYVLRLDAIGTSENKTMAEAKLEVEVSRRKL